MLRTTLTRNREVFGPLVRGLARGAVQRRAELRHHVVRDVWTVAKRFGATGVTNVELREIPVLREAVVEGWLEDPQRMQLAALSRGLGCRTFFEIGTNRGRTAWTVARADPDVRVLTLDVPLDDAATSLGLGADDEVFFRPGEQCGEAFRGTPEAERITQLWGDSATFDVAPWAGAIDFVYIDGAHTYDYVRSDTAKALTMLSPTGTIAWDDYTTGPGVYRAVNELAGELDTPIYHLFGSRMAFTSRRADIVHRIPPDDFASLPTV